MYLATKISSIVICIFLCSNTILAQEEIKNRKSLEIGLNVAGDEVLYYGGYGKYIVPLSHKKHHFIVGLNLTMYFDFRGESEPKAYLKNDVDMRVITAIHIGYSLNYKKAQLNFELPVGTSLAITKGTLVNERIGFTRDFSNTELLWHYGIAFSPKYRLHKKHLIGLTGFFPLAKDKTWSGYMIGIGWTKNF
ncbi:hypothetical protein [Aquimarina longa]|uniref:hypothetical protein n=1 Tax=Aquimarina longa TaxID=1080221 RepID=UPI000781752D|nr:hypothetical protein [Aquimarina longa]